MRKHWCNSLQTIFTLCFAFNSVFINPGSVDCQGHEPAVSRLSPKIQNKLHDMSQLCQQDGSTQSKRDYHIALICPHRAFMHENRILHSGSPQSCINLYSGKDFRVVTFSYSSSEWSIYDASFSFVIRHSCPLQFLCSYSRSSHERLKKWGRETM